MGSIIRGLFNERKNITEGKVDDFFSNDVIVKILRLMNTYSINEGGGFIGVVQSTPVFLERLSYQVPEGKVKNFRELSQLHNFFINSNLNEFLSTMELFVITLMDLGAKHFNNHNVMYAFVEEFNNLLALKIVPFRLEVTKDKVFMDRINSPKEEEMKQEIYAIIDSQALVEINEHFTNALITFAKKNYPESIEESYLALEKYLKIKVNNHKLDAPKSYAEFKKIFDVERGIFKLHHDKIREKISFVYTARSELKSHSDKNIFDRKDFLEETARFQVNEVMNLIILLEGFKKK